MTTLLQITQNEDGSLSYFSEVNSPLPWTVKREVFHLLRQFDPALRRRAAPYEGPNPELAQALITWRRSLAQAMDVPPYFILHQRVLFAIADAAPQTEGELLAIPGFGTVSFEKYGLDILRITCK